MKTKTVKTTKRSASRTAARVGSGAIVRALRAEIETLRRDATRLDWLQAHHSREIRFAGGDEGTVDLTVWHRRYISSYDFNAPSVRAVIDQAMRQAL